MQRDVFSMNLRQLPTGEYIMRVRPPAPRWCNAWTAAGLLLAVVVIVIAELGK